MIVGLVGVSIITFIKPERGLLLIIFSMLLSPELSLGGAEGKGVVLRLEDLILVIVVITWLANMAIRKDIGFFKKTPLNRAIAVYVAFNLISTSKGMVFGNVEFIKGFFFVLKYIEYFFLYYMVVNQVHSKKQIKVFLICFFITCFITCVYAVAHIGGGRLSTPFETGSGEPNTLGGYCVIMLALIMGIFLYSSSHKLKMFFTIFSIALIMPSFLFTLSRSSYLAIGPMWITLIILGPKKHLTSVILILAIGLGIFFMPNAVRERLLYTVRGRSQIEATVVAGVKLDPSSSARVESWKEAWKWVKKAPLLGYGVTGIFFIDGQYIRVMAELGFVGLLSYLFLLWTILRVTVKIYRETEDRLFKGVTLGFIAGYIGILVFNIGSNGFILTRIMEPFWFLLAMVIMFPHISTEEEEKDTSRYSFG